MRFRGERTAFGAPGILPRWAHGNKEGVGTAYSADSKLWFTLWRGVVTEVYYPLPLHLQPVFSYLGYKEGDFPVAEQASKEALSLPVYPELSDAQQDQVAGAIAEFYNNKQ